MRADTIKMEADKLRLYPWLVFTSSADHIWIYSLKFSSKNTNDLIQVFLKSRYHATQYIVCGISSCLNTKPDVNLPVGHQHIITGDRLLGNQAIIDRSFSIYLTYNDLGQHAWNEHFRSRTCLKSTFA